MAKQKLEGFVMNLGTGRSLIGREIVLRWVDYWGEAYYPGVVTDAELWIEPESPQSVKLTIDNGVSSPSIVIPLGHQTEIWEIV